MTKHIDTNQTAPVEITDDLALTGLVHEAASLQLVLNEAEAKTQSTIENAKRAFAEATAEATQRIAAIFAGIEAYCAKHRDRLFPLKGGKRSKTYQVLQHKLQYRCSESLEAPKDIVQRIFDLRFEFLHITPLDEAQRQELEAMDKLLAALLRQPPPELNKDTAKACLDRLPSDLGLSLRTDETFKLAFSFTPEQA